jgi:hypothetical protein
VLNFLKTVLHYASVAWSGVTSAVENPVATLESVWHFIGSVQTLLDNLFSNVNKDVLHAYLMYLNWITEGMKDYLAMVVRIKNWIWGHQVNPTRINLLKAINAVKAYAARWIHWIIVFENLLYLRSIKYTLNMVTQERGARIKDVLAARAYSVKLVKACLATVQQEAADGYNSETKQRQSVIVKIADDLITRNPAVKTAVADMIKLMLDAAEIDDPLIRVALNLALGKVIDSLGIDKVAGSLMGDLIDSLTGSGPPKTLESVAANIAARITALEDNWADFMVNGGPEVEQAGESWKKWASIIGDAAIVGFFGAAVADPTTWAAGVNDTAGALVNGTVSGIADLIRKA